LKDAPIRMKNTPGSTWAWIVFPACKYSPHDGLER